MTISILACLFSPRLYRIYSRANQANQLYQANIAEQCGDFAISYMFPAGVIYTIWHRKLQYILYLGLFIASSYAIRAVGRAFNPSYLSFLEVLKRANMEFNTENAELIRRYDFEFKGWPIGFRASRLGRTAREALVQQQRQGEGREGAAVSKLTPCWILGWALAHTAGIRLIYPGLLLGPMLRTYLEDGRAKYVTEQRGVRTRVESADGNRLDTMFFDRRRTLFERLSVLSIKDVNGNGKILVICCEGNAGFYEIGMAGTPINEGYSVLGWNHPGFGGSSGVPYPLNEMNAAEAIFEYATRGLGYKEEEIILYGWSIGGYPAAYLASQHPNIKGLVLDATFDDILPLALPRMPQILGSLVRATIRYHVDIRVTKEMREYKGPVRLIRRTDDEIISEPPSSLTANRGNYLLIDIICQRYPALMDNPESERALRDWLAQAHVSESSPSRDAPNNLPDLDIPSNLQVLSDAAKAALVVKIAEKLLTDHKSTHCTPLPGSLFLLPWGGPKRLENKL